ncbi:uncharacterized protein LOC127876162 [Dreissena polymorpha]|uniref:Caspase family p20 domain-containing protein n=1 Tax=Dreissena polymorpha TaxID=45954 RepID=A0A9D4KM01_DREPO|nr:uncharacterized protein LOC127876162 [Dreissena polymorpha]XP_052277114.1 uncharacterized protein LOC127876162 [Dreissena polymorpha]XP_052277115.1 uncharacterized protein LOC127876162 [Dreissena polymorpha]XP_052277116.1 uncharacterized protein LOC127876162 [Dreissena polymorpha]XP_052277117.1 uncharacterized protein LOC127876162 [Dreissena polymorpha]XP_052277118.1 uncharacterized protein LOC127876162 [Dreissena polymorpha]KAH3841511.1 hypothetical protein DPMN_114976 [Dreissena polymorp
MGKKNALIIVNRDFPQKDDLRYGAIKDYNRMCLMFGELGFSIKSRVNRTAAQIQDDVEKACSIPCDCFLFVISTHGEEMALPKEGDGSVNVFEQRLLGTDGQSVAVSTLITCLDNDVLKGTPKLCFIQACRSSENLPDKEYDTGVPVMTAYTKTKQENTNDNADGGNTSKDPSSLPSIINAWYDDDVLNLLKSELVIGPEENDADDGTEDEEILQFWDNETINYLDDSEQKKGDKTDAKGGPDKNPPPSVPKKPLPKPCDVAPVDCPRDCLIMYPVQPHKIAIRNEEHGSWMLKYLFEERSRLKSSKGNIFPFLTSVMAKMSEYDANIGDKQDLKMCGTIYHRLTTEVILKRPGVFTRQFRACLARAKNTFQL